MPFELLHGGRCSFSVFGSMVLYDQVYHPCRATRLALHNAWQTGELLLHWPRVSRLVSSRLCRAEAVAEAHRAALLLVDTSAPRWRILFCNTAFAHLIEMEASAITALPFWDQFVTEVNHCCPVSALAACTCLAVLTFLSTSLDVCVRNSTGSSMDALLLVVCRIQLLCRMPQGNSSSKMAKIS